ncbi:galactose-binding like protein [Melanomma pulvis-pyrius CBS 109.77]|uniref:Galactose-binding like protein n=1 Tax=Melanomma pulvis-pyrius CBS 109.77 TaxID=1314802 RepID=A0A6A6XG82_9PLEO|nr:galactose-binding like protein [Melanomma pulvis-pyrius CBS 109.77]
MASLRRRGQGLPVPQSEAFSDSEEEDHDNDEDEDMMEEGETIGDEVEGIDGEEEEEEEEEEPLPSPDQLDAPSAPIPPNLREISTLASWTVSSSKPGCSIPQLRSPSTSLFWQSDGPQPHYLNIHFFKLVRIVGLRLFLDFEADESYTPTRIVFLAGSGGNDLVEWGEMRLEQPRGWIWADFSGVGDADDDDDGDDEEDEDCDEADGDSESESIAIPGLADALDHEDDEDGSDFENAQPGAGASTTQEQAGGAPVLMSLLDTPGPSNLRPYTITPLPVQPAANTSLNHPQTTPSNTRTPTLARNHPRLPFQPLHPAASPPPHRKRKPKMPVLRAHLVQIKILENHQNGKDTHLRGLQIFARDNEGMRATRVTMSPRKATSAGVEMKTGRDSKGLPSNGLRRGAAAMGGMRGLGRSEWDVEPSIR